MNGKYRFMLAALPLAVVIGLTGFFYDRLGKDPGELPSALIGKPVPDFTLAGLDEGAPGLASADLRAGTVTVVNVFASWCAPCVKEMPELDRFAREHAAQGWRVLGLAVDNARAVREFLRRTPVSYAIAMAGFEGSELARKLGNAQSGLPFTVAFDRGGRIARTKAGETNAAELAGWAREMR